MKKVSDKFSLRDTASVPYAFFSLGVSPGADFSYQRVFSKTSRSFSSFVKEFSKLALTSWTFVQGVLSHTPRRVSLHLYILTPNLIHHHYCNTATRLKPVDIQIVLVVDEVSHPFNICHKLFVRCR